jgi:hypothetical protein
MAYGNKTEKPAYSKKSVGAGNSLDMAGPKGRGQSDRGSLNQPGPGGVKKCCVEGLSGKAIPTSEQ